MCVDKRAQFKGLYRFRGATIRNILEFPSKFKDGECTLVRLVTNYRSNSDIIDFYNSWMKENDFFDWENFRLEKKIEPKEKSALKSPAVVKQNISGKPDKWFSEILSFILELKESGKLSDYNQVAFLFRSVKRDRTIALASFLESNGISVYSPRSNMFFKRDEIMLLMGILMLMFPFFVLGLEENSYEYLSEGNSEYFFLCLEKAKTLLQKPESKALKNWVVQKGLIHNSLKENTDYSYTGLIYRLFEFSPFCDILATDLQQGLVDARPARNIALFTQLLNKFEFLHRVDILDPNTIEKTTEALFVIYIRLLLNEGLFEYEDDSEYAPSGCVSFLTIHQSKGMEFPIVFVDSLYSVPRKNSDDILLEVEREYYKREPFEPAESTKFFDFWRLYYTAFSRAQDLLILTSTVNSRCPSKYFRGSLESLSSISSSAFNLNEFTFHKVKNVNIKQSFSFTSHIAVYETCSLQYKFFKELDFTPVRISAILFGVLVHQTIEDIHKSALRKEEHLINAENIELWLNANYSTLSKRERAYLAESQKKAALKQVLRYAEKEGGTWDKLKETEVDISLVKKDYIIKGTIDLIRGEGDTVDIVDFKAEKKPKFISNSEDAERVEYYRRQLELYAYLLEERTGQKVNKMHLYYTGEEGGVPTISYEYKKKNIDKAIMAFDNSVQKILKKEYTSKSTSDKVCKECDFKYFCTNLL